MNVATVVGIYVIVGLVLMGAIIGTRLPKHEGRTDWVVAILVWVMSSIVWPYAAPAALLRRRRATA